MWWSLASDTFGDAPRRAQLVVGTTDLADRVHHVGSLRSEVELPRNRTHNGGFLVHRNARLSPQGRLLLCQRIEAGWPVLRRPPRWAFPGIRPMSGGADTARTASPDSMTVPAGRGGALPGQGRQWSGGSWVCGSRKGLVQLGSPGLCGCRRRRSTGCWCVTGSTGSITSTGPRGPRSVGSR